jgi:hypothetical protein
MIEPNITNFLTKRQVHAQIDELASISALCTEICLETFGRRGDDLLQTSQDWKTNKTQEFVRQIRSRIENVRSQLNGTAI